MTSRLQECLLYQIKEQIKVYLHYVSIDALGCFSVKLYMFSLRFNANFNRACEHKKENSFRN